MAIATHRGFDLMQDYYTPPRESSGLDPVATSRESNLVWSKQSEDEMKAAVPGGAFAPKQTKSSSSTHSKVSEAAPINIAGEVDTYDAYDDAMETVEKKTWKPSSTKDTDGTKEKKPWKPKS